MNLAQLKEEVIKNIKNCWLLSEKEKVDWLFRIDQFSETTLKNILKILQEKNTVIDKYLLVALENEPENQSEETIKNKLKQIKKRLFQKEEKNEKKMAEKELENLLKKSDETFTTSS